MRSIFKKLHNRCFRGFARQGDIDRLYDQLAGLLQIQNAMEGAPMLKPMRGWAISPDALAWVLTAVQEKEAPTMIEFGSGQSTVALAAALKHRGGHLISVEHDPEYLSVIERQVSSCGLNEFVKFVEAPLIPCADGFTSYDVSKIPATLIDVALIDGPPIKLGGPDTRLIPLRWAAKHLEAGGVAFLDDSNRSGEQTCIERLGSEFPSMVVVQRKTEKGLVQLTFG